ncbi:MAG TPA: family 43 glycosylhydrolase [Clostridiales bacterium]|nr:family 43 glycosylhydrolase [Clostridiales bacterium]
MLANEMLTKGSVLVYTRSPIQDQYSTYLAYSAHLAYSSDGTFYQALNQNYGVLFATATISSKNTINAKGLKKPYLFYTADGSFGVVAIRINADGSYDEESKGKVLMWTSKELIQFHEIGLVDLKRDDYVEEVNCEYDQKAGVYTINWKDTNGNIYKNTLANLEDVDSISYPEAGNLISYASVSNGPEGAIQGNVLAVDHNFGTELLMKWSPLENIEVKVPDEIKASSVDEVNKVTATAVYTDGSTANKPVLWNADTVDFTKTGMYEINGTVTQESYPFPLARGYADPDLILWKDKYYFIATNDNTNGIGLYVREADTVLGLFEQGVKEYLILDVDESKGLVQTFWAPEFHVIGDELYILFAYSGKAWGPQSYVMKLKKGGSIVDSNSWEDPIRVMKMDGTYLATSGITLDMTYFEACGVSYLMWSYRIWNPEDSGSMLYIATINPEKPWLLTSEPVLISRPLYGWENHEHTINNEGPYALLTKDYIYITYSGGAAGGYSYALGLLRIRKGENLLEPKNWVKSNAPVLSYYSMEDVYGPGHNTFYKDSSGNHMIIYHAQGAMQNAPRCTAIHRVHYNRHDIPVFNMSEKRDLNQELVKVRSKVIVQL